MATETTLTYIEKQVTLQVTTLEEAEEGEGEGEGREEIINEESENVEELVFFIAVHAGAGFHSEENAPLYRKAMKEALQAAGTHLLSNQSFSAVDAVEKAIQTLEDNNITNAGIGSNLTVEGTVECDASIMDGRNTAWFGAVGAIEGVRHPISVARKVLEQRKNGLLSLGRVPPMLLVGEGARKFGELSGIALIDKSELITEKSQQAWQKYTLMIQAHNKNSIEKKREDDEKLKTTSVDSDINPATQKSNTEETEPNSPIISGGREKRQKVDGQHSLSGTDDALQDTVGAVCVVWRKCSCSLQKKDWCECGLSTAAGVSSGGILMKFPGRVGEAAIYGGGCWAQQYGTPTPDASIPLVNMDPLQSKKETGNSVAISTTGTGEQIMQTMLAWNCAHSLQDKKQYADEAFKGVFDQFLRHQDLQPEKFGGVIGCQAHIDEGILNIECVWGHTTESMALGYLTAGQNAPKTMVTRLSTDPSSPIEAGFCVNISSKTFRFNKPR